LPGNSPTTTNQPPYMGRKRKLLIMSKSVNLTILTGRVGKIEIFTTSTNKTKATLSVATSERYKDKAGEWQEVTDWHTVVFWERNAEIARDYVQKGSLVQIFGANKKREYTDKDSKKQYVAFILGRELILCGSPRGEQQPSGVDQSAPPATQPADDDPSGFAEEPEFASAGSSEPWPF
jgi:single-strand DNA-binding protein